MLIKKIAYISFSGACLVFGYLISERKSAALVEKAESDLFYESQNKISYGLILNLTQQLILALKDNAILVSFGYDFKGVSFMDPDTPWSAKRSAEIKLIINPLTPSWTEKKDRVIAEFPMIHQDISLAISEKIDKIKDSNLMLYSLEITWVMNNSK